MKVLQSVLDRYEEELKGFASYHLWQKEDGYWIIRDKDMVTKTFLGADIVESEETLIRYVIEEAEAKVWQDHWNSKR